MAFESVHAVTYFAPASRAALRQAGLKGFWAGYFAARAAPLGWVDAGPVMAAFYNFHPGMVARAVPGCWDVMSPADLCALRCLAAVTALGTTCGSNELSALAENLPLLRRAAGACSGEGRILTGANRELWATMAPALIRRGTNGRDLQLAEVWQHCTTLREHRGDGHVAALVAHGLSGLEAHLLASATAGVPPEILRDNRGWSEAEWSAGADVLVGRGLLGADGGVTVQGQALHTAVEDLTDRLAEPACLSVDGQRAVLYRALAACAVQVQASVLTFPNPMGLPPMAPPTAPAPPGTH